MSDRKEYNNRWDVPLVNPGTNQEPKQPIEIVNQEVEDFELAQQFENMLAENDAEQLGYFEAIQKRSNLAERK